MLPARLLPPHVRPTAVLLLMILGVSLSCARRPTPEERERMLEQGDQALTAGNLADAERQFGEATATDPNDARAVFGLGLARLRLGRSNEALTLFERATELDPNNPDPAYLRAHTLARLGRRDEAIDAYRALIDSHAGQLQATLQMVNQMIDAGRLEEARRAVMRALERSPRQFSLLVIAGRILGLTGAHSESIDFYKRAREVRPYAPQPVYGLVEAYRGTGRVREAGDFIKVFEDLQARAKDLAEMEEAAEKVPTDPRPALLYIDRLFEEERLDEAVEKSGAFIAQFPALPAAGALAVKAAQAALKIGDTDAARGFLRPAESTRERGSREFIALAEVYEGLGDFKEALELYDRYLQEKPGDGRGLLGMGRAAMQTGQLELAEPPLRRALALMPQDAGARASLGLLLIKKGDPKGGAAELTAALDRDPRQPDALFGLGFLAHQQRDTERAERYLKSSLEVRPGDARAEVVLALVLSEKGRCEEAIPLFTRTLEDDYRNMTLQIGLIRCLEQSGRMAEAAAQRKIAEEILGKTR